jgi:hypothetical protein
MAEDDRSGRLDVWVLLPPPDQLGANHRFVALSDLLYSRGVADAVHHMTLGHCRGQCWAGRWRTSFESRRFA